MRVNKNFSKQINKISRKASRRPVQNVTQVVQQPEVSSSVDIGNWRITEDESGSLILYNFETGNKVVIARP